LKMHKVDLMNINGKTRLKAQAMIPFQQTREKNEIQINVVDLPHLLL
jgi:hypothetical protein